jgi:hypothetical protein
VGEVVYHRRSHVAAAGSSGERGAHAGVYTLPYKFTSAPSVSFNIIWILLYSFITSILPSLYISTVIHGAVWKVRRLTLLPRVGTLWRCGDGLFFEVPPLASDALLITLHPLLENVLQTVCRKLQEDSGTGGFHRLITPKFRNFFQSASTTWKPQLVSLHRLHRFHECVTGFLIHFFQAEHRIKSRNADAPLRKYLVAPPS